MLKTFNEVSELIAGGKLLHIAGTEELLRKLPKGNWIGGSTEYFMTKDGGMVTNDMLFVDILPYNDFKIYIYDEQSIYNVASDAFENGFSIVILPFDSGIHKLYAEKAPGFSDMFMKNIVGWISGVNLDVAGQTSIAVNGMSGEACADKAAVLHIGVPEGKTVNIGIVNIFTQDGNADVIEFNEPGFSARECCVNGEQVVLADYIADRGIDTKLPLVGDYSGVGVNISFKFIEDGIVNFYAPVFPGIKYKIAKSISDYVNEFNLSLLLLKDINAVFSCNCILNFLYGELEGKSIGSLAGPITFGEIAYQLVNQTLVYVIVS